MYIHLLGLLLAGGLAFFYLLRALISPLRSVPGPLLARCTDSWYLWRITKGKFEFDNIELHRKHGPVIRYGPNRFSFDDPQASKIIYGHGTHLKKSAWYETWNFPKPTDQWNLFEERNQKRHALLRKPFSNTYSTTSLVSFEPYIDECTDLFVQRLRESAGKGVALDFGHWLQCYAFDVIGNITFARRFGFLDHGDDIGGVISALETSASYSAKVGVYPQFHGFLFKLAGLLAGEDGSGFKFVNKFANDTIKEYRDSRKAAVDSSQSGGGNESFLSMFYKKHEEKPTQFTSYHVFAGCAQNVGAGSDTTAISLSATFYHLLKNPQCFHKLREEIDDGIKQGTVSQKPTFKETQSMPYLQAVIKEALRLHPATGFPLEREVPEGGATISGRFFPAGTIVGINAWVEHRNKQVWGEDADQFRPERWLIDDADKLSLMNRHWIPFGMGSRVCIGKNISLLEMQKLVPLIVREFDLDLAGGRAWTWTTINHWFVKPKGFKVLVNQRNDKAEG
ncbi:hypothetical protein JX266_005004 [Neoarthrinium moseri]|nr:hypothetical protein JX266_005004 [Neoarthrinium moseri]